MQARDYETENACGRQCRQAVQTRPCGGIPADLTFLLLFWSSKKVEEMYDPVIARFFSPDQYVQNATATQSYNRYSYCLNNPLMYTDPSGQQMKQWTFYTDDGTHELVNHEGGEFVQTIKFYSSGGGGGTTSGYIPPPTLQRTEATNTLATYRGVMLNTVTCSTSRAGGVNIDWSSARNGVDNMRTLYDGSSSKSGSGNVYLPKIPINDVVLKNLGYVSTSLDVTKKYLKYGRYARWITNPITALSTYNALADLVNQPSFEHFYRFLNAAAGFTPWGGAISSTLNIYEDAATWGIHQIQSVEIQLQSRDFWSNMYGY